MSTNEPDVVDLQPVTTATIRSVVAVDDLTAHFDRAFRLLAEAISAQGVTITGPAFSLYHDHPGETTDCEVGFPTDRPVREEGDVRPGSLPGGRVARLVHHGGYERLGATWDQLQGWLVGHHERPTDVLWEVYVTEPSPDMGPADLRTELNWLLA